MKCWIILCLSLCAIYQCVTAGNGYVYDPPLRADTAVNAQSDSFIDEFISTQKQNIFSSISPQSLFKNKCAKCSCGVPNSNRIIGGTQVRHNKYPWMAQLLMGTRLFCGATLINDRYLVTAAHCMHKMNHQRISARLLQFDRNSAYMPGVSRKLSKVIIHESYNPNTIANDIAVALMDSPVPLSDTLRPVCLPSINQNFDLKQAIVAGWGLTKEFGKVSTTLQEVTVPVITNAKCKQTTYGNQITETMLCAGIIKTGGKDACQGDSGGPLIVSSGTCTLIGVVSFGQGCAKPNAPGVYTRVSKYLAWINKNTADACYCNK